jgi:hypothetical protein
MRAALLGLVALVVVGFTLPAQATTPTQADIITAIYDYAARYGVSGDKLYAMAHCETGGTFNPFSYGRAGETGLFQWHPRGEWWNTPLGRLGYPRPWGDIHPDIAMAAWALANGRGPAWSCYWYH